MVAFYKHNIQDWTTGTSELNANEYRVYHVVIQLIMQAEEAVPLHERRIAGACNMRPREFKVALESLIAQRKLVLRDGRLWNLRAMHELEAVEDNRRNAGKGGKTRAERMLAARNLGESEEKSKAGARLDEKKSNDYNDGPQAPLHRSGKPKRHRLDIDIDTPSDPNGSEAPQGALDREEAEASERVEAQAGLGLERPEDGSPPGEPGDGDEAPRPAGKGRKRAASAEARGCRIPEDFATQPETHAEAVRQGFVGDDAARILAEFCDHWRGVPGAKGRKVDWPATWRNRLRKVHEVREERRLRSLQYRNDRGSGGGNNGGGDRGNKWINLLREEHGDDDERGSSSRARIGAQSYQ